MRSDEDIKRDVEQELRWDPDIDPTDIAVAVRDGVVTLTGFVRSYAQKWEAEQTAKRVAGVRGVANDLEVRLPVFNQRPDPEIARDAVSAIRNELPYSADHVRVVVHDGWITLEGDVEWYYQRDRAEAAVRDPHAEETGKAEGADAGIERFQRPAKDLRANVDAEGHLHRGTRRRRRGGPRCGEKGA